MRSQIMNPTISVRGLHTGVPLFQAVKRDVDPETGLYYHDVGHGNWAISLLERPPKSPKSLSVIGHIQPGNTNPSEFIRENPDKVNINEEFWNALHHVLQRQITSDEYLVFEAEMRENGWAHLCDARHMAMPGRISPPEAIFGSVAFTDSKLVPDSYERNDTYRFAVKHEGPMKLRQNWLKALRAYLEKNE
ncbi:hypothetical protein MBRA1_001243 [Malassezia brasiliensis]|uniref:Uncharacterized protein n=1 Tax=Malassezia brasiliensis TaxID=1821822 RepID=A0AAF0DR72_9BASI|nr:hypothetical protein MBRA1_001243 [Malassezia brasiliensis]